MIIGRDFMKREKIQLDFANDSISVQNDSGHVFSIALLPDRPAKTALAKTLSSIVVPPQSEYIFPVKIDKFGDGETVICEPPKYLAKDEVVGGKCVVKISNGRAHYRLMNPTLQPVFIKQNSTVAVVTEIIKSELQQITDLQSNCTLHTDTQSHLTTQNLVPHNASSSNSNSSQNNTATHDNMSQFPFSGVHNLNTECNTNPLTDKQYTEIAKEVGINLDDADLTDTQKQKLYVFLGQNRKVFAKDFSELGKTHLHSHRIETYDNKPISKAPYRQSPEMRRETERQTKQMLEDGIIEESNSPWHAPILLVRKKNQEWRFAVDCRALNSVTEPQSFPLPHISDVFDTIADAKAEIFTVLDLKSGFWQVPLDPSTAHKSAFITHQGVYQFTRLPFGLMNAPITFQALMTKVLRNLN